MRRLFAVLLLLMFLVSVQPAHAQGNPTLSSVAVWIWPEYYQPGVLVIYHVVVDNQIAFPTTLAFPIPAAAGKPYTVAVGNTPETVSDKNVDYSLEQNGDWVNVVVKMTGPAITLEYYDPSITVTGKGRQFQFVWPGDYAVSAFAVEVQRPYDASQFESTPALMQTVTANDQLTYYQGEFGALALGNPFTLDITYQKASDSVSKDLMPVAPVAPVDTNTAGRVSLGTYVPWLVGGAGVLLVAGGLYYYFRGQPRPNRARRRHIATSEPTAAQAYCPQCGTRARSGDRFCRTCGSRMRGDSEE